MEFTIFIGKLQIVINGSSFTKSNKVLDCFWNLISKHIDGNVSSIFVVNIDRKDNLMSRFQLNYKMITSSKLANAAVARRTIKIVFMDLLII